MNNSGIDLDFLLDDFVARVPHVSHVIAVSADGLLVARSSDLPKDSADQLSAVAAGLVSLLKSAAKHLEAGSLVSNLTELNGGFMFAMSTTSGASVLTLAAHGCDIGQIGFELGELINKVGAALTPAPRADLSGLPIR